MLEKFYIKFIVFVYYSLIREFNKALQFHLQKRIGKCGTNTRINFTNSTFCGVENFEFGSNVYIPHGATFYSTNAKLIIGDNVMFGPNPTIITGDHRTNVIGVPMCDVHEKLPENDLDVCIDDEVWCGANVTILKGVTIGRGSIVAACSLVSRSAPPYSIIAGVPAKFIKFRFNVDEILQHEAVIYPMEKRLSKEKLEELFSKYHRGM